MVDAVRQMLASIEQAGNDGTEDYQELKSRLVALQKGDAFPTASEASGSSVLTPPDTPDVQENQEAALVEPDQQTEMAETEPPTQDANPALPAPPLQPVLEKLQSEVSAPVGDPCGLSVAESSIRVDVGLLDKLMNMVGELVLTRNQILQCPVIQDDASLQTSSQSICKFYFNGVHKVFIGWR